MKGWGLWVQVSRRRINIDLGHCRRQPWAIIDSLSAVVVVVISNLMIVTIVVARSLRSGQRCRSRSGRVSSLSWVIFEVVAWSSQAWSLWSLQFNDHELIVAWSLHSGQCCQSRSGRVSRQGWGQGEDQALIHCWIDRIDRLSGLVFAIDVDKQIDGVKLVLI